MSDAEILLRTIAVDAEDMSRLARVDSVDDLRIVPGTASAAYIIDTSKPLDRGALCGWVGNASGAGLKIILNDMMAKLQMLGFVSGWDAAVACRARRSMPLAMTDRMVLALGELVTVARLREL